MMHHFRPILIIVIASLLLGFCLFSCNTEPETEYRIDLTLPDSLSKDAGKYDSLVISILDTNGNAIRANAFQGAFLSRPNGGILKGIVLGGANPVNFVIAISAYQSGVEKIRTQITVRGDVISPIVLIYSVPRDSNQDPIPDPIFDTITDSNPKPDTKPPIDSNPKGVNILESELVLSTKSNSQVLTAHILPDGLQAMLAWSTGDPKVVEITNEGILTPKSQGSAWVYVTILGYSHIKDSIFIRVVTPAGLTSLRIVPTAPLLYIGGPTHKLQVEFKPDSTTPVLIWNSSDTSRISVGLDGTLTGKVVGEAKIKVKAISALAGVDTLFDSIVVRVSSRDTLPPLPPTFDTSRTTASPTKVKRPTWAWLSDSDGIGVFRYSLNSNPAVSREDTATSFTPNFDLTDGTYTLTVAERDSAGNWSATRQRTITVLTRNPDVKILSPKSNEWVKADSIEVIWSVDAKIQSSQTVEKFSAEGVQWIVRRFTDSTGNQGSDSIAIRRDITPPEVVITSPRDSFVTSKGQVLLHYRVDGVEQPAVLRNLPNEGIHVLTLSQGDSAGNVGSDTLRVFKRTKVIFVNAGKTGGDGTSWESAYGNLGEILDTAKNYDQGTQVWIAEGEYEPTHVLGDNRYLFLRSNLELYGGFKPGMVALGSRNRNAYRTIITGRNQWGDILLASPRFQVKNSILDGFWFQNTWGAIMMDSAQNITIRNCFFDGSGTRYSRALLLTDATIWVTQCKFANYRFSPPDSGQNNTINLFGGTYTFESDTVINSDIAIKLWGDNRATISQSLFTGNGRNQTNDSQVLPLQLTATDTLRIFSSAVQGGETSIFKEPGAVVEYGTDNFSP